MAIFSKTKRFDYVFAARTKTGRLPCDTVSGWERVKQFFKRGIPSCKKAKLVHPRDWDDEPYLPALMNLNIRFFKMFVQSPGSRNMRGVQLDHDSMEKISSDIHARSDSGSVSGSDCLFLFDRKISRYICGKDDFEYIAAKVEFISGDGLDVAEGLMFIHVWQ